MYGLSACAITAAQLKALNGGKTVTEGQELFVRCTLTSDFQLSYDVQKKIYNKDVDDYGDYVADQAVAQYSKTHIKKTILADYDPNTVPVDAQFLKVHSCTKVVSDGSKLLFYDDAYNSCEWYKTVVGQVNYLSYGGNLNFRTNKNEKLIGVVIFDKNIVVFSDNEQLGGNISVVTGLLPTKGLALPFISYGGTNLMSALISVGMLINVSRQSDLQRQREKSKISAVFHIKGD